MNRRQDLTAESLRAVIHYDPSTGVFTRISALSPRWLSSVGKPTGLVRSDGYVTVSIRYVKHEAGRLAWLYMTGKWPDGDVDHRDGNGLNNQWSNLRDVPHKHNIENRTRPNKNNTTGYLGVTRHAGCRRFIAQITYEGRVRHLGLFDTAEQAHEAYVAAKRIHHQGNTL